MNQLCYRLVFNRARGLLMAVAETTRSHGGSGSGTRLFAGVPVAGLLMSALMPAVATAQIIPDRSAAPDRQPIVGAAPNGVPLVNIQTPNGAGVSRNAYSQFDVQRDGAILNNATQSVQTALGGWVQANPLLNRSASVIVNEVNSSDPSLLRGHVEVAGQRAQLIIANPSGISCDGCGFINAYRTTLTTGVPHYGANGNLDSYIVRRGIVSFAGDGLDASSADFTDVIARAVQVNAALRAQQLTMVAGSNDVDAATLQPTAVATSETRPEFAVDVGALGGMYARKIWLVGTEGGVGVRNAGTIGGGTDEIRMTAAGRLEIMGIINSTRVLDVQAAQGLSNSGIVYAGQRAFLQVAGDLDNRGGVIASAGDLSVQDASAGELTLRITNTGGTLVAGGNVLSVDAASLSGDGKVLGATDVNIRLTADYDHAGELAANRHLSLMTAGTINNHSAISAGESLHVTADKINNEAGGSFVAQRLLINATAPHALINRGLIDGGEVRLRSTTIKNLGTGRIYGDHVMIDGEIVLNEAEAGAAPVIAARTRLDIAADQITNREGALLYSEGDLAIGRNLDEQGRVTGQARLLENTSATIEAKGDVDIAADEIRNTNAHHSTRTETRPSETVVEVAGSGSTTRYRPDAPGVYPYDDESVHLHTPEGNYESWERYDYQRSVTDEVTATSSPAQILAGGNLRVRGKTLTNDKSRMLAGADLDVQAVTVRNIDAVGTRTITDRGTVTSFWRDHDKGTDSTGITRAAHEPSADVQAVSLGVVAYKDHTKPEPTGIVDVGSSTGESVRTVNLAATVPESSLYRPAPATLGYLVETDPRFANYRQWLASDYLLERLALDPQQMNKRLGDGFYEQKLVREQVAQLTGRRFLPGYANDEAQFQSLMDNGVTFAQAHQLRPGVALSAEQMAALTSDIVWLVEKDVTLPDGQVTRALVPQVYVQVREGDLKPDGTLLGGEQVRLSLTGDLNNGGSIAGRQVVNVNAANVRNLGGTVAGGSVIVNATTDINSTGGQFRADKALVLTAGNDITVASTTRSQSNAQGNRTNVDRVAGLYVSRDDGQMVVVAGHDLTLKGAEVQQGQPAVSTHATITTPATGRVVLAAGNDVRLDTVTEARSERVDWGGGNHRSESSRTEVASTITATGAVDLVAGRDVAARGAQVVTRDGAISVNAGRDVALTTSESQASVDESHRHTSSGFLSSTTYSYRDKLDQTTQQGTLLSGNQVGVQAGQDIRIIGSNVASTYGTALDAARNVTIEAATDSRHETHMSQKKTSGLMGSGGFGVTIGTRSLKTNSDTTVATAVASTVGSTQGDVSIVAGETARQAGSAVLAPNGDVRIAARKVDIVEARSTQTTVTDTQFRQSGVTVAVTSPVISAVQTAQQMSEAASNTKDDRMKMLAGANTAMAAANAYDAVKAGQGTTINGKADQISTGKDAAGNETSRDANAADKMGGIQVSISVGSSKSDSHTVVTRSDAVASNVGAGHNVTIKAAGDRQLSDVTVQGSQIAAGKQVSMMADHALNLQAAANAQTQVSDNSSSSASVGVVLSVGSNTGFRVNVSGSLGRGNADGSDLAWSNSRVAGGEQVSLQSGADTTIKGAVVSAPQVTLASAGQLNIESLQDSSIYKSRQEQVGGSVTFGAGASANLNYGKGKIDSTYTSVVEQSGVRAGDGGFDVAIAGDPNLKGGAITSTQAAVDAQRNTFVTGGTLKTSDIENRARYEAETVSVNVGTGFSPQGSLAPAGTGVGFGKDSDRASSTTRSGISGVAGDAAQRTGDKETGIAKIFDADTVQKEVTAQTQITQTFSTLAPRQVAAYADGKIRDLQAQQGESTDPEKRAELQQEIGYWADGGRYRVALHAVVGGMAGGVAGATGAGTSAAVVPQVADAIDKVDLPASVKTALIASTSTLIGAAVGGTQGAGAALSEATNNFLSHQEARQRVAANERLLQCKDDTCRQQAQQEIKRLDAIDQWRDQQIASACMNPASDLCKGWYAALSDAKQSYQNYAARDDVTQSIAGERRQVNEQEFLYRQRVNNPFAFGVAKGLMKLTPPALVVGVGLSAYEVTTAVIEVGAADTAIAIARNLKELPGELRARLNSEDPTVRGEALVDTLAIAGASTAIVGRLQQTGGKAISDALEKQTALRTEAKAIERSKIESNARKDDADIYFEFKNSDGRWNWPPNNGAKSGTASRVTLEKGYSIDRYGDETGYFAAPTGDSISGRSLAPGAAAEKYQRYEVVKPIPNVEAATVAPAFGQDGGGVQFRLVQPLKWYVENGYLKEIK